MAYRALYRKHRPQRFDQVVGQGHVTVTLAREVADGNVSHAYLFAGPRGTGKTTTARLLAKALNCTKRGDDPEPCNDCLSCLGVNEGTSLDVIELDAASHNKVEDVREMRVNAGTVASVGGARRVYILDEAHMLSRAAGNALLKILEEPPDHVHFVLATTEPYKLPDTIRSRAQRFDFHPITLEVLGEYVAAVARAEQYALRQGAVDLIAEHAKGSARDALSLLEQVAALGGGTVEPQLVTRALGLADRAAFARLTDAIAQADAPAALGLVAELASEGADLRRFVAEALAFYRGVFLAQYAPNLEEIVDEGSDTIDAWRQQARAIASGDVLRTIDQLAEALVQLREGREERLVVELALLRMTRPETAVDPVSLAARIDRVEERVKRLQRDARPGVDAPDQAPAAASEEAAPSLPPQEEGATGEPVETEDGEPAPEPGPAPVADLDIDQVASSWPAIVARLRDASGPRRHALFRETTPVAVDGAKVILGVPEHLPFHLEQLGADDELRASAERIAAEVFGGAVRIEYRAGGPGSGVVAGDDDEEEPAKAPDKDQLEEAPESTDDPAALLAEHLGAKLISEE